MRALVGFSVLSVSVVNAIDYTPRMAGRSRPVLTLVLERKVSDFIAPPKGSRVLEGLCWLSPRTFVLVSDLSKRNYSKRCQKRDQSIHVFRIPTRHRR